jgi:hypothetical protein
MREEDYIVYDSYERQAPLEVCASRPHTGMGLGINGKVRALFYICVAAFVEILCPLATPSAGRSRARSLNVVYSTILRPVDTTVN